jgi:hypothetical protein
MRFRRARNDEKPGRVAIETVHDPRSVLLPSFDCMREQAVYECSARMPRRGMDDHARRLVDDEQMFVLPRDSERYLLGNERRPRRFGLVEFDLLSSGQPVALRPRGSIDEDALFSEQPLRRRAGADLGDAGEKAIEPLARGVVRNALLHARAAEARLADRSR